MRPVTLIVMSLAILVLYAFQSFAVLDGGLGLNADQLIEQSIKNSNILYAGFPVNPQVSRNQWSEKSGIDFSKIGNLSGGNTTAQEARSSVDSVETGSGLAYQTESNMSPGESEITEAPNSAELSSSASSSASNSAETAATSLSLAGTTPRISAESMVGDWSFRLRDSKNRILALKLFASENSVFGTGTINDGGDTLKASASGSMASGNLSLDVTTSGSVSLYRLEMAVNDTMTLGEYRAFSQNSDPWTGIVEGTRRA